MSDGADRSDGHAELVVVPAHACDEGEVRGKDDRRAAPHRLLPFT